MKKLGLAVALAGVSAYKNASRDVTSGNEAIRGSAIAAAEGGDKLSLMTVALGNALAALATTAIKAVLKGLGKLAKSLKDMVIEAGPVRGLEIAFEGLTRAAGSSREEMLRYMRESLGGMAANRDMMRSFNRAAALVSLDFAKVLPEAMKYLGKVAFATGEDIDYLMNSLVIGIGRMQPLILDNLSVQVSLADATKRAAEMYGVQADALTKTQKQMGLVNIVMEKLAENTEHMPEITGSAVAATQSLTAIIQDARDEMGKAFLPIFGKMMSAVSSFASKVMPKIIPVVERFADRLMKVVEAAEKLKFVKEWFDAIKKAVKEFGEGVKITLDPIMKIWKSWAIQMGITGKEIVDLIQLRLAPIFANLSKVVKDALEIIGPIIEKVAGYLNYFFRVYDKVFKGIKALLEGNKEDAKRLFADAWLEATAVVIAILKGAAETVISWGKALVANYATGIIEGIQLYLSQALQAIASYLTFWMAPTSPPKFLPNIGKWGTGAAEEYLKGFGSADFGTLQDFSGQFRSTLAQMVKTGALGAGAFAKTFFQVRGALTSVIGQFKETGKVSAAALDIIRTKLGRMGEGYAEMIERSLEYKRIQEEIKRLQEEENEQLQEAQDLYERGEIGAEEYEDLVRAVKRRGAEEKKGLEKRASGLEEEMAILQARMDLHKETQAVLGQQESMMKKIASAASFAADKLGDVFKEEEEKRKEREKARKGGEDAQERAKWEFDFGELLPSVEEIKAQVVAFFTGIMDTAKQAILDSKMAQFILTFVTEKILPAFGGVIPWMQENVPKMVEKWKGFWEEDWPRILEEAKVGWANFTTGVETWWEKDGKDLWESIEDLVGNAGDAVGDLTTEFGELLEEGWEPLKDFWEEHGKPAWDSLAESAGTIAVGALGEFIEEAELTEGTLKKIVDYINENWDEAWEDVLGGALDHVRIFYLDPFKKSLDTAGESADFFKGGMTGLTQYLKTGELTGSLGNIKERLIELKERAWDPLVSFWEESLGPTFTAMYDVWEALREKGGELKDMIKEKLLDILEETWEFMKEKFLKLWGDEEGGLARVWEKLKKVGEDLKTEVLEPILGAFLAIWEFLKDKFLPIWGDGEGEAGKTLKDFKVNVLDTLNKGLEKLGDWLKDVREWLDGLAESIRNIDLAKLFPFLGKSPSPFEKGLRGITSALQEMKATGGLGKLFDIERQLSLSVMPTLGAMPATAPAGAGASSVDHSVSYGGRQITMPVTIVGDKVSLVEFKEQLREVLWERN